MEHDTPLLTPASGDPASIAAAVDRLLVSRGAGLLDHSKRTGQLAHRLARHLGMDEETLQHSRLAGELHDVGKIDIPDSILLKPSRLNPEEWKKMQTHSAMGEHRLVAMGMDPRHPIVDAVRHHHESYDGRGYPDGMAGEAIPLLARIISIADSYDAIASARSHHGARSHREIMDIMRQQKQHYDPVLLKAFFELMDASQSAATARTATARPEPAQPH